MPKKEEKPAPKQKAAAEPKPKRGQQPAQAAPEAAAAKAVTAKKEQKPAPRQKAAAEPKPKRGQQPAQAAPEMAAEPEAGERERPEPRLKVRYREEVAPALMERFGFTNLLQVPRIAKVVVNMGVGAAVQEPKTLDAAVQEMAAITGQKPAIRRAKKSIAQFRLRAKTAVGCAVTLRGDRAYEFLDRLFNIAIPRIRDFRGLPARSFDGRGNYSIGLREQVIFPELDLDRLERVRGLEVTIATTARTDEQARELLARLGLPIREG